MKKVVIMRGVPGSGKSTYVNKLIQERKNNFNIRVVSADHHFTNVEGQYLFKPDELRMAHRKCFSNFMNQIADGVELLIVDNTNIRLWEFSAYLSVAGHYGYEVEIVEMICPPLEAGCRQIHAVPVNKVEQMAKQYEAVPKNWYAKITKVETFEGAPVLVGW